MFTAPLSVCNNDAGGTFPLYTEPMLRTLVYCVAVASFGVISLLSQTASQARILVHGHRGARARRPENTIPAFQYAIQEGVDALEMDMAVTKDNVIVISHDPILHPPVCSGPEESAVIHELTLAEVGQWDCGKVQNPRFPTQMAIPGTRMPTLDEVFQLAPLGKFDYNIETKSFADKPQYTPSPEEFVKLVLKEIRKYKLDQRIILQSFDFRTLVAIRKLAPKIRLSALTEKGPARVRRHRGGSRKGQDHLARIPPGDSRQGGGGARGGPSSGAVDRRHARGLDMLIQAKVDAIISDDPAELIAYLKKRGLR